MRFKIFWFFTALILVAHAAGISNSAIATSAMIYFWARLAQAVAYLLGIPWLRTVASLARRGATMVIAD